MTRPGPPSLVIPAFAMSTLISTTALADGAFPDELQVFAPHLQPNRIVLSTNYGLILSEDNGATWSYACETGGAGPQQCRRDVCPRRVRRPHRGPPPLRLPLQSGQ